MGGDTLHCFASEDESSLENDYLDFLCDSPTSYRDEDESKSGLHGFVSNDFGEVGHRISSNPEEFDCNLRRRTIAYNEIMNNYDELWVRRESLYQAKKKVLRYTPGSGINDMDGRKRGNYFIPKTTTLLLVGPKGSGKSSLVNRISRVFEDDKFASDRAQVTYNSSSGEGTFFLEEYMIPRGASSFCLFDTRSLSENFAENEEVIQHWMTKGVCHGELVIRDSDSSSLRMALKCKAQQSCAPSCKIRRKVNFVIFVVNGLSVIRSVNSDKEEDKRYMEMVLKTFNYPYLSFKDDKPVVAVTHGDLLSLRDRARVRIYLGEKLGVPPAKQIFDIPEKLDPSTELAIVDMIRYSLEHADKNLPYRESREWADSIVLSVESLKHKYLSTFVLKLMALLAIILAIVVALPMHQHSNYNHPVWTSAANWSSRSEVKHPYEPHKPFVPFTSNFLSRPAVNDSQENQAHGLREPETISSSALASKSAVARSAPALTQKSVVHRPLKKRGSRSASPESRHPESAVKWHKIRHLWLDDKPALKWHKIRHLWLDDEPAVKWPKIRHLWLDDKPKVKWHKIRHLWCDDK